jgi:shikimate kinase
MAIEADNVALIGMPAAGKTAVGERLAARTRRGFVDTDALIRQSERATLEEVIAAHGVEGFRSIETRCITALDCTRCVISTGGSAVYSEAAMLHLGRIAVRVYLDVPLDELKHRVGDLDARGVLRAPGQDLAGLLDERRPLYERWADVRVHCGGLGHDAVIDAIIEALAAR